nr:MAG TPA: hypothetical protein [Caudoviricetes sp.]
MFPFLNRNSIYSSITSLYYNSSLISNSHFIF